jgi:tetratricopeptide (TPR) repeat protein
MRAFRLLIGSLAVATLAVPPTSAVADDQGTSSVQRLLERGAFEEAVQRADGERNNPESTFLAAQALSRMSNNGAAAERFAQLRESGDGSWRAIGESGASLIDGDVGAAMAAAERAVSANGDNPFAHYQVGLVANRQQNHQRAAEAFSRATQLKPDLAYAHYYAGAAFQRIKQIPRMSEHFELFLKLAPDAPESTAVSALLRTLRPRW